MNARKYTNYAGTVAPPMHGIKTVEKRMNELKEC